jgi:hypothetical protein
VDRLTTGRRHVRAGSVSVTELITKQATDSESPAPEPAGPATTGELPAVTDAGPTSHRRQVSRGAQLAKIAGLSLATAALCSAVGVATTIAHQRAEDTVSAPRPAARISGEQALLPDQLDRSLGRDGASAIPPPKPDPATNTPSATAEEATSTATAPAADAKAAPDSPAAAPAPQLADDLDVVRRFYEVVPRDPELAFGLISPELLHSTLGQFLQSWSHVHSVDVLGLQQRADGVLAVVRMQLNGNRHLQLQQLLTVADSPRRIVGVELLSAQRN